MATNSQNVNLDHFLIDSTGWGTLGLVNDDTMHKLLSRSSQHPQGSGKILESSLPEIIDPIIRVPKIESALKFLIGEEYRVDHAFFINQPGKGVNPNLHGGHCGSFGSSQLRGPIMGSSSLGATRLTLGVSLNGQNKRSGGYWYIPGSHKSSFSISGSKIFEMMDSTQIDTNLTIPKLEPGECHIFFDHLIHGASPVHSDKTRAAFYVAITAPYVQWDMPKALHSSKIDPTYDNAFVAEIQNMSACSDGPIEVINKSRKARS